MRGLRGSHLLVLGPPGTGKTRLGGQMLADYVKEGPRVGLMAYSHKAINNLIGEVLAARHRLEGRPRRPPGRLGPPSRR